MAKKLPSYVDIPTPEQTAAKLREEQKAEEARLEKERKDKEIAARKEAEAKAAQEKAAQEERERKEREAKEAAEREKQMKLTKPASYTIPEYLKVWLQSQADQMTVDPEVEGRWTASKLVTQLILEYKDKMENK